MLNNFIYAKAKSLFEEKLSAGEVLDEAIVFIEDTKEIWNHGTYFASLEDLQNSLNTKADISTVEALQDSIEENELVIATALTELYDIKADKTAIPDTSSFATKTELTNGLNLKQDNLVSGTNIKTINGTSIVGSGNITTPNDSTTQAGHYTPSGFTSAAAISNFVTSLSFDSKGHVYKASGRALTSTDIPALDASKITSGTISIERLPAGALERLVVVASESAALSADVQEGDVVQVTGNNNKMYFCVNSTATTFATKFKEFTAGTATSVPWSGITGMPDLATQAELNAVDAKFSNYLTTSGTAASASKLSDNTAYTIWGQTFFQNGIPANVSGALSASNINITSTDAIAHLSFGRGGGNFVTMPSGGYVGFISNGKSIATANADLVITDGIVYPGTTGVTKLGFGDKRWSDVASVNGDFSGALTAGTFSTSSVVACGGRLRVNASNSVSSFGFLKATAYTASLNRAVLDIGSNYGGSATITSEAVDVVAISMYRGAVGVGRAFTYDELYANYNANTKLTVDGNMSITGTFTSTGDQIAGSDIRYKEKVEDIDIPTSVIANAPLFSFKWTDRDDKDVHIGTSAQYWEDKLPEFVKYDPEKDFKHLNYGGLGVSIGISLAKKIEMLEQRIVELEKQLN